MKRILVMLSAFLLSGLGMAFVATPAQAAWGSASCPSSQPAVSPQVSYNAFALHKLVVKTRVCKLLGPLRGLVYVGDPSVTLPTRVPGGGVGEQVEVSGGIAMTTASKKKVVYRYTVKQTVLHIPGATNFVFDTTYEDSGSVYRARTCFVNGGSGCSGWVNF